MPARPASPFDKGDRVRLIDMQDPYAPVPAGTLGTVTAGCTYFEGAWNIPVHWDNGRTLSLVSPPDRAELVSHANR